MAGFSHVETGMECDPPGGCDQCAREREAGHPGACDLCDRCDRCDRCDNPGEPSQRPSNLESSSTPIERERRGAKTRKGGGGLALKSLRGKAKESKSSKGKGKLIKTASEVWGQGRRLRSYQHGRRRGGYQNGRAKRTHSQNGRAKGTHSQNGRAKATNFQNGRAKGTHFQNGRAKGVGTRYQNGRTYGRDTGTRRRNWAQTTYPRTRNYTGNHAWGGGSRRRELGYNNMNERVGPVGTYSRNSRSNGQEGWDQPERRKWSRRWCRKGSHHKGACCKKSEWEDGLGDNEGKTKIVLYGSMPQRGEGPGNSQSTQVDFSVVVPGGQMGANLRRFCTIL